MELLAAEDAYVQMRKPIRGRIVSSIMPRIANP